MKILTVKRRADFIDIQNNYDKKITTKDLVLLCKKTAEKYTKVTEKRRLTEFIRIGLTVTKKIDKRAVIRNRIKRLLREINRNLMKNYENLYVKHYDYEFIAKKTIVDCNYNDLLEEIKYLLENLKIGEENGK